MFDWLKRDTLDVRCLPELDWCKVQDTQMKCTSKRLLEELSNTGIREMNWLTKLQITEENLVFIKSELQTSSTEWDWLIRLLYARLWLIDRYYDSNVNVFPRDHCKLGCVCDSIRMRPLPPAHCGKVDCMFECRWDAAYYAWIVTVHLHNLYSLVQLAGFCYSTSCRVSWSIQTASFI